MKSDGDNNHCGTPSRKRSFVEGLEEIMPSPQDYKEKVVKFSDLTTAHGWKRAAIAKSEISKSFWILLLIALVGMFLFQAYTLTDKFRKHETITGISLKFDKVDFPAITFCNLNPYKRSLIRLVPSIRDTMDVYDNAKFLGKGSKQDGAKLSRKEKAAKSIANVEAQFADEIRKDKEERMKNAGGKLNRSNSLTRVKREITSNQIVDPQLEAIEAHCVCFGSVDMECIRFESPPETDTAKCICTYNKFTEEAWPCYNRTIWYDHTCPSCNEDGHCDYNLDVVLENEVKHEWPCVCKNQTGKTLDREDKPYCIPKAGKGPTVIRKLWAINETFTTSTTTTTTTTTTTPPPTTTTTTEPSTSTSTTTTTTTTTTTEPPTTTSTMTSTSTTTSTTPVPSTNLSTTPQPTTRRPRPTLPLWASNRQWIITTPKVPRTTRPRPTTTTTPRPTQPTTTVPPTARPDQSEIVSNPETIKAMGFTGMTDGVAMLTKAKENLMFTMAGLSADQRRVLSHQKHEFIEMCSFNGKQCDIDTDFREHIDPEFGNCFTFNYDTNNNFTSSRAGPMYGIRVLLFVNTSDYMSTSESSGVRITIHGATEYPFPDTFGYSAPVGFASSFGMKKKVMERLPAPFSNCKAGADNNDHDMQTYIYQGFDYSPEGCHRSCFQNWLLEKCDCGDPRFPVPPGHKHCSAFNATARDCLDKNLGSTGDFHHMTTRDMKCVCEQSCRETIHEVTFSASKWPSGATDLGDCGGMTEEECENYYRLNAAMVEVFYEQLNYELLQESEAYGFVNLVADFGGHLGLWLGKNLMQIKMLLYLLKINKIDFIKKDRNKSCSSKLSKSELTRDGRS
ncbi:hypothetical protein WR25_06901 isoform B [Diploscapter pachys]|uniref:Degenerin mec-10 n=1 Tax=Diploscapter pachys TaxID=2018661 RepID=A0A2A2L495_9BILA|nr:hypothetical protein WR25_06901 isoform B [Diploscapter pachys]